MSAERSPGPGSPVSGFLSRMFTGLYSAYSSLNGATLTGAIDVIVVRHADGSMQCSPFHVRFGKTGVLSSKEKEVEVAVNGKPLEGLQMRLGHSGEAYFLEELAAAESLEVHEQMKQNLLQELNEQHTQLQRKISEVNSSTNKRVVGRKKSVYCKTVQERRDEVTNQLLARENSQQSNNVNNIDHHKHDHYEGALSQRKKRFTKTRSNPLQQQQQPGLHDSDGTSSSDEDGDDLFTLELASPSKDVSGQEKECRQAGRPLRQRRSGLQSLKSAEQQLCFQLTDDILPRLSLQVCSDADISDTEDRPQRKMSAAKSDTELDRSGEVDETNWGWGRLPVHDHHIDSSLRDNSIRRTSRRTNASGSRTSRTSLQVTSEPGQLDLAEKGQNIPLAPDASESSNKLSGDVLLDDDVSVADKDPQASAKYFGKPCDTFRADRCADRVQIPMIPPDIALSLCGGRHLADRTQAGVSEESVDHDKDNADNSNSHNKHIRASLEALFEQAQVTFDALCADPSILEDPSLIIRINGEYFSWKAAGPLLIALVVFRRPLPSSVIRSLRDRPHYEGMPSKSDTRSPSASIASSPGRASSWWPWTSYASQQSDSGFSADETPLSPKSLPTPLTSSDSLLEDHATEYKEWLGSHGEMLTTIGDQAFRKTLRLSSDRLLKLGLKAGINDVEFSVTTSLQGTTRCTCHIFLWEETDKIVVSDIDGTITISDILGHVMPMLGKGWEHTGVAALFNKIANNGYKFIYLSARAIGQASMTRGYLRAIRQDSLSLPVGPVLLNPTSLLSAIHREVIIRRPQDFKISCLKDIQSLFPTDHRPFYAGFGNRLTDTLSYRAVSIDTNRIFTINSKGELRQELIPDQDGISSAFSAALSAAPSSLHAASSSTNLPPADGASCSSTYYALSDICDQIFPPRHSGAVSRL